MMELLFSADAWLSLVTLSLLEIVLGIDNLIFIALIVQNLPPSMRDRARYIGLGLALGLRLAMLFSVAWIMGLTEPLFSVMDLDISFKDLLLLAGGGFLIVKATTEIHADLGGEEEKKAMVAPSSNAFAAAVAQIVLVDLVFSFDSVITAVGMTPHIPVIVLAVMVSMVVMVAASGHITRFLHDHPAFKMLALSFIIMIGTLLIAEGMHFHVPRGYIYFAFAFSLMVELLNTAATARRRARKAK
jgi:predicted tellurium resistance membrane protein TerC